MKPISFVKPTDSRAIRNAAKTTRFITNFDKKKYMAYSNAISEFESKFPEYKGLLYISSDPEDVVDVFGRTIENRSALMLAKRDMIDLSDFWDIFTKCEERLLM